MTVFLADPDVTLWHGDVLETLRGMPDGSVDCVITSPPYWGLRDYQTGSWEGGDPDCDHLSNGRFSDKTGLRDTSHRNYDAENTGKGTPYRDVCGKCGASRQDRQLGLEATPDLFVARMVNVFREVRRVLAAHGTCWVNLGDSYATGQASDSRSAEERSARSTLGPKRDGLGGGNAAHVARSFEPRKLQPGLKPKDLVGIPWRVAFALQADGWYLRSDIIWAKPNPMPESVTDRPTKAHEYVFLLTKQPRYWFDQEAVREPHAQFLSTTGKPVPRMRYENGKMPSETRGEQGVKGDAILATGQRNDGYVLQGAHNPAGRNIRSVWEIATQPYPEAHFATYPEELVRRCLLAGCPEWVCRVCGKPRERIVEKPQPPAEIRNRGNGAKMDYHSRQTGGGQGIQDWYDANPAQTLGWSDCGHNNYRPGVVLDPFVGSGTTCHVARKHGRHAVGIDLNADYLALAARRLQQQSLFAEGAA